MTAESNKGISVAFVCLGNICRSPMAEAIFKHTVKRLGVQDKFDKIDSFGTSGFHVGSSPDRRSVQVCKENCVEISHHAQRIGPEDFNKFDYILAMDHDNYENLEYIHPSNSRAKVALFGEYREDPSFNKIVEDPYYGGKNGFDVNFKQITHFSEVFIKRVLGDN